jgi:hypothetical protein
MHGMILDDVQGEHAVFRVIPRDAGVQHEQDAAQDLPVIQPLAARVIRAPGATSNNGSIRAHSSSDTIHGGCSPILDQPLITLIP